MKKKFMKSKKCLMKKNAKLREEINILKPMLEKFNIGSQKLQLILNNQKVIFDKARITFNPSRK